MKMLKKSLSLIFSLILMFTVFSTAFAVSAAKAEIECGLYYFVNEKSGKYLALDGNNDKTSANIQIESYNKDSVNLVFKIKNGSDNTYKVQPAESTTRFIGGEEASNAANIELQKSSTSDNQAFYFYEVSDGIYTIRPAAKTTLCLTAEDTKTKSNVSLSKYSEDNEYQQWKLEKFSLRKEGDDENIKAYGIDVSKHQGEINWKAVKEYGVEFAIIRIGYSEVKDERFEENYKAATELGIDVGVYLYSYNVNVKEAARDAKDVLKWLDGRKLQYPVYYDIEDEDYQGDLTTKERTDMCLAFMEIIEAGGYSTGVYANQNWFNNKLDSEILHNSGSTWLARWPKSDQADEDHSDYNLWQFRSDGKVAGINGNVDMNVSYGNYLIFSYTGKAVKPTDFPVYSDDGELLTYKTDYKITYKNNINIGMATAEIIGINDYENKLSQTFNFKIVPINLGLCEIAEIDDRTYSGIEIIPTVNITYGDVKLKKNVDFTIKGEDNLNAGTGTVILEGMGNYGGIISKEFTIKKKNVKYADFEGIESQTYNGKKKTLSSLKVKTSKTTLKKGTDYTVSYENNKSIGTATVTIKGIGDNCKGTISKTFKIVPKSVKNLKASKKTDSSMKISWDEISYISKYQIYRSTSPDGDFSKIYTAKKDKTSYTDTDLKEGKYYYYKIRAYKTVDGVKYYGRWSDILSANTKLNNTDFSLKYNQKKNGIEVNIKKDKHATGYIVYMYYSSSKSYKKVWSGTSTQYIKENINPDKNYSFKIRTYKKTENGKIYSSYSEKQKIKVANLLPADVTGVKASKRTLSSLKISWKVASKADRYQIYRATSKDGKYTRIDTVKSSITSYTDTDLKEGTYYYYKIRAYKKVDGVKYYSEYSDILATKTKISDTTFSLSYSKKQKTIKFNIKKDKSVTGYIIYMYDSSSKSYKKLWTGTDTEFKLTNVKADKTYRFKIRTYKKTDNGKIYGTKSGAKKVST